MKKRKIFTLALCMLLVVTFCGERCLASMYIYNNHPYTITSASAKTFAIANPSSANDLTVYVYGRPDKTNQIDYVAVYKDPTYTYNVVPKTKFPGGDPSVRAIFTLPKNTTYYALVSTESTQSVSGKFSAYY